MKNEHIGSNFDNFLKEEGLLTEVEAAAAKRAMAYELQQERGKRILSQRTAGRPAGKGRGRRK